MAKWLASLVKVICTCGWPASEVYGSQEAGRNRAACCTAYTIREPSASFMPFFVSTLDTFTPRSDPDTED